MVLGVAGVEEVVLLCKLDPEMTGASAVVVGLLNEVVVVVLLAVVGVVSLGIAGTAACGADFEDAVVTGAVVAFVAIAGVLAYRANGDEAGTFTFDFSLSIASGDSLSLSLIFLI